MDAFNILFLYITDLLFLMPLASLVEKKAISKRENKTNAALSPPNKNKSLFLEVLNFPTVSHSLRISAVGGRKGEREARRWWGG